MADDPVIRWTKPGGWKDVIKPKSQDLPTKELSADVTFGSPKIIAHGLDEMNEMLQTVLANLQASYPDTPLGELLDIEISIRFKS